jgi:hypothetical protein
MSGVIFALTKALELKTTATKDLTINKVVVVFPNNLLREQDSEIYAGLKTFMESLGKQIECVLGLEEARDKCDANTLLCIEEADYELVDLCQNLPQNFKAVFAVSATDPGEESGYEKERLQTLGFTVYDSKIPCTLPHL